MPSKIGHDWAAHGRRTALVFLPDSNIRRLLVKPDAETLEFGLDEFLVAKRLEHIQDDEDEIACPGD